jgi:hypothetical protein
VHQRRDLRIRELEWTTFGSEASKRGRRQLEVSGNELTFRAGDRARVTGDGAVPPCSEKLDVSRGLDPVLNPSEDDGQPTGEPQAQIVGHHPEPRRQSGKLFLKGRPPSRHRDHVHESRLALAGPSRERDDVVDHIAPAPEDARGLTRPVFSLYPRSTSLAS